MALKEPSPFEVILVAEKSGPVIAHGGMKVIADHSLTSCPRLDILVVPGGWGTRRELKNPAMLDWLRQRAAEVETLTSVCTGSMLLGFAGLLDGLHATTHWNTRIRTPTPDGWLSETQGPLGGICTPAPTDGGRFKPFLNADLICVSCKQVSLGSVIGSAVQPNR
jgi:putative intracellular protease/amidase